MTPPRHTSRFATLVACAVAATGTAVPLAQASPSQSLVPEHSTSQNRVDLRNAGNYGPLDPAIAAAIRKHQDARQASAAGNYSPLDPAIAAAIRNHQSARQASAAGKYGPLDPAIAAAIRNHAPVQYGPAWIRTRDQGIMSPLL
jgi:hypothetical protein